MKLFVLHFLFTQVIIYSSQISHGVEDYIVRVIVFLNIKFKKESHKRGENNIKMRDIKALAREGLGVKRIVLGW